MKQPPHPTDEAYPAAYSEAWTNDPQGLLAFFADDGTYADIAMGTTYRGHDEILRFHRWMLKFAPDSVIEFTEPATQQGRIYMEWTWSGSFAGALRLRDGRRLEATGDRFSIVGIGSCRFGDDGKLTSHRDFWDAAELVEQLTSGRPAS
ncbi:hypothetical protein BOO86_25590 [Mycobacterium sp. CBMA 234]|uniref:nuclear transport factor 2 family protein n=1 Tax=Mycolicibacterium sp. CBMA 234 TaxID=1918495 RepID=UPI001390AD2E|nr:nuclear transport factor 2 family protein [Mycolicibacterium sp. CBMA 234]MUL67870.1 hypothetical protein [Mycolicibacterium sp. CBMA 234]